MSELPRWRVNQQSFIGHSLVNEGDEVNYTPVVGKDGKTPGVSENLTPLNDAAQAIVNAQTQDHPDKPGSSLKADKAAADTDKDNRDTTDGLVKRKQGDTRDPDAIKAAEKKAAKKSKDAPADDVADKGAKSDVGADVKVKDGAIDIKPSAGAPKDDTSFA